MARLPVRTFGKGLWVNGARDQMPEGTLRRLAGAHDNLDGQVRSIDPLKLEGAGAASALIRFADNLWKQTGADVLIQNGVGGPFVSVDGAQNGTRVTFHRADVQPGADQYLFWAGGGLLKKADMQAYDVGPPVKPVVTKWGIDSPTPSVSDFTLLKAAAKVKIIETFDVTTGWADEVTGGATPGIVDAVNPPTRVGAAALRWTTDGSPNERTLTKNLTASPVDLYTFTSGEESADQDHISLWLRFEMDDTVTADTPASKNPLSDLISIDIAFSTTGGGQFDKNMYTFRMVLEGEPQSEVDISVDEPQREGIAQGKSTTEEADIINNTGDFAINKDLKAEANTLGRVVIPRISKTWIQMLIPKASFEKVGPSDSNDWADIDALRFTQSRKGNTNRDLKIYFDQLQLQGGASLQGKYSYHYTFLNSVTGHRSNPNTLGSSTTFKSAEISNIQRNAVDIVLDVHIRTEAQLDPQVDTIELWRTLGNGALFWKLGEVDVIDNGEWTPDHTFNDIVSDHAAFWTRSSPSAPALTDRAALGDLTLDELPFDNLRPNDTVEFVVAEQYAGRTWLVGDTSAGNLDKIYYTRVGRPESVADFLETNNADDPVTCGVVWNDQLYIFSTKRIFRVVGDNIPFSLQQVWGAVGTQQPHTVMGSAYGIFYQADDGIRIFDGSQSRLVGHEAIAPLMRGLAAPRDVIAPGVGYPAFEGTVAAFAQDDYWISNGVRAAPGVPATGYVLAWTPRAERWRIIPLTGSEALYCDPQDQKLIMSQSAAILKITDTAMGSNAIDFVMETPSIRTSTDADAMVQRLFVDIDTGGQNVTLTLVLDTLEVVYTTLLNTASRQTIECSVGKASRLVGVRLEIDAGDFGNPPQIVTVYGIEFDVYAPGGEGG